MPSPDLVTEVARQLDVCNACRYCEGYCAVFPAMELRRKFDEADVIHLANLCFDCRACYNACPFTPPHEYAINIPAAMSAVRVETYREYSSPRVLARIFAGNARTLLLTAFIAIAVLVAAIAVKGSNTVFGEPSGGATFYRVVPYAAMLIPALALSAFWLAVLAIGGVRFWRATGRASVDLRALLRAAKDALGLEYLKGGGDGCDYPGPEKSNARVFAHHALVAGVLLDLASTTLAAVYHHFLNRDAPYAYVSPVVVLGAAGGVLIVIGVFAMLWLKAQAQREPASTEMLRLDYVFLMLLMLTSASGLVLLTLRSTAAMGTLLALHLGIVAALFLVLTYSKFAHVVYRYAALVRNQIEMRG